jgi:hypothetical protein
MHHHPSRRHRPWIGASLLTALVLLVSAGCTFLGDPLVAFEPTLEPTPRPTRTPRPPSRWRMRFCDAQIQVKRALIVIDQTRNRLRESGSAAWFEEVGDDLADLAERGLEFMDVVPRWRPARSLVAAERAMLEAAAETGRMIERVGEAGRSEPRSGAVRMGMRTIERRIAAMDRAIERAAEQGIPCARPDIPSTEEILGG